MSMGSRNWTNGPPSHAIFDSTACFFQPTIDGCNDNPNCRHQLIGWSPQFACDLEYLQEEHRERCTQLDKALLEAQNREATNWQSVLTAISITEKYPVFM